jgi:succinate-acetate transporter protein
MQEKVMVENHEHIPTQIHLEPVAAPSILGLYGYAAATFVVAARFAGWYGDARTELLLFPFAAMVGGMAQFAAAMWAYKARDGVATAMHGTWGAFWLAYGILSIVLAVGTIAPQSIVPAIGYWFVPLALFSAVGAYASLAESGVIAGVWGIVAIGSACAAIAGWSGSAGWMYLTGWVFLLSSLAAWYAGSALMLEHAFGHIVLPVGSPTAARVERREAYGFGEPGVIRGQA